MKWILVAVFVLANAVLLGLTEPAAHLTAAADGGTWYEPAVALLHHGAFVDLNDSARPATYRPPMFTSFAAAAMAVVGGPSLLAIVVAQVVVLLMTGLVVRWVVRSNWPGCENLAFGLTLFNPNAVSTAHLVQSDTVFTFFVTLLLGFLLVMSRHGVTWRHGLLAGAALGAACLTRPTPQFLILTLPILLLVIGIWGSQARNWRQALGIGILASVVALAVVFPWALYLRHAGEGLTLTSPKIEYRYVWDQVQMIDSQSRGRSYADSGKLLEGPGGPIKQYIEAQGISWGSLPEPEQWRHLTALGYREFFSYPVVAHVKTWARSQAQFFFAAGAGNFQNLLGISSGEMARQWFATNQSNPFSVFSGFIGSASGPALAITALTLGFTVVVRLLDLAGLMLLVRERQWSTAVILLTAIAYFALIHIYVGNSRYRLAIDPALIILATLGYDFLRRQPIRTRIVDA